MGGSVQEGILLTMMDIIEVGKLTREGSIVFYLYFGAWGRKNCLLRLEDVQRDGRKF